MIDLNDFRSIFQGAGVRSWLDWDRLNGPEFSVREVFSRTPDVLAAVHTVWYVTPSNDLGDWRRQADRRLTVAEASQMSELLTPASSARIDALRRVYQEGAEAPILVLPSYRVEGMAGILLDGNHRAVAAVQSGVDVRIMLFEVAGPPDPLVLPDLLHEQRSTLTQEEWDATRVSVEAWFEGKTVESRP